MKKWFRHLSFMLLLGSVSMVMAQTVTGTISDANGPVPGVNVLIKGTSSGTQTDFDGNYSVNASNSDILVFSFLGYKTQEIAVGNQSTINVTLQDDTAVLDEVVVIGYGTTTVKDATGSVASVTSDDFNGGIIASAEQLIQGKTAGVQITSGSGEPGAGANIRIRGSNSIRSNNNPLIVVDGVPLSGGNTSSTADIGGTGSNDAKNPLSFINPNDIESVSVLKDASATAIYGSRGANGVLIVTTKSGKGARNGILEYNSQMSFSSPANRYDLFNAEEFITRTAEVRGQSIADDIDFGNSTDWQNIITRNTVSTNQNLSYRKGFEKGNVNSSFSYGKQFGVLENSELERITARLNGSYKFLNDKLKISLLSSISRVNDETPPIGGTSGASGNLIGAAYGANPTWTSNPDFAPEGNLLNPANLLAYFKAESHTNRYLISIAPEYQITDEFSAKLNVGYDSSEGKYFAAWSSDADISGITGDGQAAYNFLELDSKLMELTLNYKKDYDNITVDALVGYSYQDFTTSGFNSQARGLTSTNLDKVFDDIEADVDDIRFNVPLDRYQSYGYDADKTFATGIFPTFSNNTQLNSKGRFTAAWLDRFDITDELQSFFGRVNLTYLDKYLFTGTLRADGSTRFGGNNKYGIFPSAALAWKLHQEDFVGDTFSTLKVRLGYGITGNQEGLGHSQFLRRSRVGDPGFNGNLVNVPGRAVIGTQNPDLRWESTSDLNLGLDFGVNNDRFSGSLEFYRKETNDLLILRSAPAPAPDPTVFTNVDGNIINQGVELSLNYDVVDADDYSFNTAFNISYNKNSVEGLSTAEEAVLLGPVNGPGLTSAFVQKLGNDRSLFSFYLPEYSVDSSGNVTLSDADFVDKDALPDVNMGLSLSGRYKKWTINAYLAGQFGFYVYNNTANAFLNAPTFSTSRNTDAHGLENNLSQTPSTLYLEKGDFIRMQTMSIGYDWPLEESSFFNSLRVSLTGQNLFLISSYNGLDPEINTSTGDVNGIPSRGIDYTSYPRARTYTVGLNMTF